MVQACFSFMERLKWEMTLNCHPQQAGGFGWVVVFVFFFLIIILPGIKELGEATCPPALSPGQPALPLPASQKFRVEEGEEDICVWALAGEKYVRVPTWELCSMHWAVSPELQVASPWVFLCLCPCALTNQCQMSEKNYQDHYSAYWDKAFMFSWEK